MYFETEFIMTHKVMVIWPIRPSKVVDFGTNQKAYESSYWSSMVTLFLSCPVSDINLGQFGQNHNQSNFDRSKHQAFSSQPISNDSLVRVNLQTICTVLWNILPRQALVTLDTTLLALAILWRHFSDTVLSHWALAIMRYTYLRFTYLLTYLLL